MQNMHKREVAFCQMRCSLFPWEGLYGLLFNHRDEKVKEQVAGGAAAAAAAAALQLQQTPAVPRAPSASSLCRWPTPGESCVQKEWGVGVLINMSACIKIETKHTFYTFHFLAVFFS